MLTKQSTTKEDAILSRSIVWEDGREQDDPVPICAWTQIF